MEALVQQILDLARLEREGDILNLAETDVREMARETAEKYGVAFRPGDTRKANTAVCDAQLLSQALSNLVENAIRYSGASEATISLERAEGFVRLAVEDHGIGVPEEHRSRLFERFYRVDAARSAETGGSGLGLAIVRSIARLHGGDATFSPVAPSGSRFEITLSAR